MNSIVLIRARIDLNWPLREDYLERTEYQSEFVAYEGE